MTRLLDPQPPVSPLGALVLTADGSLTLNHPEHGESYHSTAGAASEARALYVAASGIEARWLAEGDVSVLDIGLGLGYNAVETIASWRRAEAPPSLTVLSLEIDPALVAPLASGTAPWQQTWGESERLIAQALEPAGADLWQGILQHPSGSSLCTWRVAVGDALVTLAQGSVGPGAFDYLWQDAFSPTKNPPLWTSAWFARLAQATRPGGVLMTYSVARAVREALGEAGWTCEKIRPPFGGKKHWLKATLSTT